MGKTVSEEDGVKQHQNVPNLQVSLQANKCMDSHPLFTSMLKGTPKGSNKILPSWTTYCQVHVI